MVSGELFFLTDSSENIRTSKARTRLKSIAGGEMPISQKVLTLAISIKMIAKKYVCRTEDGATDRVCSSKDVIIAVPAPARASEPAVRDSGCFNVCVVAIKTRSAICRAINKPMLVCEDKIS